MRCIFSAYKSEPTQLNVPQQPLSRNVFPAWHAHWEATALQHPLSVRLKRLGALYGGALHVHEDPLHLVRRELVPHIPCHGERQQPLPAPHENAPATVDNSCSGFGEEAKIVPVACRKVKQQKSLLEFWHSRYISLPTERLFYFPFVSILLEIRQFVDSLLR